MGKALIMKCEYINHNENVFNHGFCLICKNTKYTYEMNWHERYKAMKKGLKLTNHDISEITGNTYDSIKSTTQPNKDIPRWLRLAIVVYERMSKNP